MVTKRFAIVLGLLAATAGLASPQTAPQTQPQLQAGAAWVVEGNVVDDRGPVPDVLIRPGGPWVSLRVATDAIHENALGNRGSVLTDINGHYTLTNIRPGLYSIYPQKDGYESDGLNGDIQSARNVDLATGTRVAGIDFVIHKAASISGRILDADRDPVPGAIVALCVKRLSTRGIYLETVSVVSSNASGEYRLDGIRGGTYYLRAGPLYLNNQAGSPSAHREPHISPVATFYPDSTSADNAAPIYLNRSEQRAGTDLIMKQAFTFCVTGTLSPELGYAQAPANMRVSYLDGGAFATGKPRPGEGFEVCGLLPGSYELWINTAKGDRVAGFIGRKFTIANRDIVLGELYLEPPSPLRGRVTVADAPADSPVPVVRVDIRSINRPHLHFAYEGEFGSTNARGEFLIPDLFADDYELVAVRPLPRGFYVKAVTQAGRDVTRDSIRPGDDLTIALSSDGPILNGETVDKDGRPVHDATVILIPKDQWNNSTVSIRSGQDGRFQIESGISPGEYSIVAFTDAFRGEEQNPDFVRDQAARATRLVLKAKESSAITLPVHSLSRQ